MCPRRSPVSALAAALALSAALACGDDASTPPTPAEPAAATPEPAAPEAAAPTPSVVAEPQPDGTTRTRMTGTDGRTFEAEFGGENELPSDFPADVPLYGDAKPMSSMASAEHGTILNLRTTDPPERVHTWYREQYAAQGWSVEHEAVERGRILLAMRKGNRISSVVITGIPEFTQVLLTVREDR